MEALEWLVWLPVRIAYFGVIQAVISLPILAVTVIAAALLRRRLGGAGLLAVLIGGFVMAAAYAQYRMEWYDVWRHGVPSAGYMALAYLPQLAGFAALGWMTARFMAVPGR